MVDRKPRLLIVGMDSVTFRVLKPLVEAGDLPTLQSMLEGGAHGVLLSTIPSVTPPGWVTSYTGVDPGKHNVFDFKDHMTFLEGEMKYELASATSGSMRAPPFWSILNRAGLTVGMVNVPMAYPVSEMDGYIIAGFPSPTEGDGLMYPDDLADEVRTVVPDYSFYGGATDLEKGRPDLYLELTNRVSRDRARAFLHLMGTRPTDVAMMVFTEVDRIQHYFWASWDPDHPLHTAERARYSHAFRDHYRILDDCLKAIMERAGPDVPVVIYSDHGGQPSSRNIHINSYLVGKGIIVMQGKGAGKRTGDQPEVRAKLLDRRRIARRLERLGLEGLIHKIPKGLRAVLPIISFETVDWSRTKAYLSSAGAQSVSINLRGRQPEGSVEPGLEYETAMREVIAALEGLVDPRTGESPLASVNRREDLYDGPFVENAPDIVIVPREGYAIVKEFADDVFCDIGGGWHDHIAEHAREGVLMLRGPGVRRGQEMADHHLRDIAPTLLHLCGQPVPGYMDGSVVEDAFEVGWQSEHPVVKTGGEAFVPSEETLGRMSPEEEELLKERLRGLGYLG